MEIRYFEVETKCGHVGRNNYILIKFAVPALSREEAASKARNYKRVKHHHPDAIRDVREISFEEFIKLKAENDADPYLHCKNIQEQRRIPDFENRVIAENPKPAKKKRDSSFRHNKQRTKERELISWQRQCVMEDYSA